MKRHLGAWQAARRGEEDDEDEEGGCGKDEARFEVGHRGPLERTNRARSVGTKKVSGEEGRQMGVKLLVMVRIRSQIRVVMEAAMVELRRHTDEEGMSTGRSCLLTVGMTSIAPPIRAESKSERLSSRSCPINILPRVK